MSGSGWEGRWEGTKKSRERFCNRDIIYEKNLFLIKGKSHVLKDKWEPGDKRRERWFSEHLSIEFLTLRVASALPSYFHSKGSVGFFFSWRHCIFTEKDFPNSWD